MSEITLQFVQNKAIGYGRYGAYLAEELLKRGVNVFDGFGVRGEPVARRNPDRPIEGDFQLWPDSPRVACPPTKVVAWVAIPSHSKGWWEGQWSVISTMWESTHVPESVRGTLHEFDQVIVPSEQNRELFSKWHDNVHLVPLGVDPDLWHFRERPEVADEFRFFIAGAGERKGLDLAYKAYRKLFPDPSKFSPYPKLVSKRLRGTLDLEGLQIGAGNGFEVVMGRLSDVEEADLYGQAHCYVQPSRGEGFGLQPLQAMAQGCPTILTDAHGHAGYASLGIGIDAELGESGYFALGDAKEWWEPDFDQLCEAMWDVYNDYGRHLSRAVWNSKYVRKDWSWSETARKFVEAIGEDKLGAERPKPKEWHEVSEALYAVRVKQPYYGEIAGRAMYFEPGKTYYEIGDVKRLLFESKVLDPDSLADDEPGLHPRQVERIKGYRAEAEWCPKCHQQLNSGIQRADTFMGDGQ